MKTLPCLGDFLQSSIYSLAWAIKAVRRHRLNDISDPYYARLQKDTVSLQTSRIPASVQMFMVLLNNPGNRPGELDFLQNIITSLRMAFYQREFDIFQLARIVQQFERDMQFPDIMKNCGGSDAFHLIISNSSHFFGDSTCQGGHPAVDGLPYRDLLFLLPKPRPLPSRLLPCSSSPGRP